MPKICSVEGCSGVGRYKTLCNGHYLRLRHYGDAFDRSPIRASKPRQRIVRSQCILEGCEKPRFAKGYCANHYKHNRIYGVPVGNKTPKGVGEEFLRSNVDYDGPGCLIWPYGCDSAGYARTVIDSKGLNAARAMCELVNGPPPFPGAEASHSCGRGHEACVDPRHVTWKTHQANIHDKLVHGTAAFGEHHHKSILTASDVLVILTDPRESKIIATDYGVSRSTINNIKVGLSWSWLTRRYHPSKEAMREVHDRMKRS